MKIKTEKFLYKYMKTQLNIKNNYNLDFYKNNLELFYQ